jgi:hypothetical protein
MRAAVFKAVGQPLAIENRPDPTPDEGEIVIKVGRCGICGTGSSHGDAVHRLWPLRDVSVRSAQFLYRICIENYGISERAIRETFAEYIAAHHLD